MFHLSHARRGFRVALVCLIALLAVAMPGLTQASGTAQLRFVHAVPGASAIDIYTDGQLTISALEYGTATGYIQVDAGDHNVTVTQNGLTTPLWQQTVTATVNTAATLVASSTNPLGFQAFQDDLNPLPLGKARLTAIHAIANGPTVDVILADGRPVIPGLEYNVPYGTLDVPTLTYNIAIVPAGESVASAIIPATSLSLASGTSYMVIAYGTTASPALMVISAPTIGDGESGYVRFVHGIEGAPAIDIYVNDALIAPALTFEAVNGTTGTPFIAFPVGEHTLAVRLAGSTGDALTGTLQVAAGEHITAAALGTPDNAAIQRFEDDLSLLDSETASFTLINALDNADVSAALGDGTVLLDTVPAGEAANASLPASDNNIIVNTTTDGATNAQPLNISGAIYGGVYYSALVIPTANGAQVLSLIPFSAAESIASAPGSATITVAALESPTPDAPTVAETELVTEVAAVSPDAQPTTAPDAVSTAPTPPPVMPEATLAPLPTIAATRASLPVARVLVDPGVNLQMRQFPRSNALSLALAPSSALLDVNGRAGLSASALLITPAPEETQVVDPASVLSPNQDLDPEQTWLYVTYTTPDGGSVNAWVNALYLAVSDPTGRPQRLANLPVVSPETAGETVNTLIAAPTEATDVITVTAGNLDPGINLNIRRTIGTDGEALARIPTGTTLTFEGVNSSREWVFVRYTAPEGTVGGWISALYVTGYTLNGQSVTLDTLEQANLLTVLPDDTRGAVEAGALGLGATATPNVLRDSIIATVQLDPGANLQLRRRPSVQAESLALLPSGTQVIVTGRTQEGEWLLVTFEGVDGYLYSQYVTLSRNSRPVNVADVPLVAIDGTPIAGTPVPAEQSLGTQTAPQTIMPSGGPITAPVGGPLPQGTDDPNLDPI